MTEYKELQIVKHALQHYIKREGADPADIVTEKRLLAEIERRIEWRREAINGKCKCWREEHAAWSFASGRCFGTKELDACDCGGDETKCDFYPERRHKALEEQRGGPSWVDDGDTYFCPYCKYESHNPNLLPDMGKYCPKCGKRVRWDI